MRRLLLTAALALRGTSGADIYGWIEKVRGVASVKVDPDTKTATVTFDPDKANAAALMKATAEAGYPASVK